MFEVADDAPVANCLIVRSVVGTVSYIQEVAGNSCMKEQAALGLEYM